MAVVTGCNNVTCCIELLVAAAMYFQFQKIPTQKHALSKDYFVVDFEFNKE